MHGSSGVRLRRFVPWMAVAALAVFSSLLLTKNIDFRVYWVGVNGFWSGERLPYGPGSGLGFPMHYRYPPATYILMQPFVALPLYWAGVLWMLGSWAAAAGATSLAIRQMHLRFSPAALLAIWAFLPAYVVMCLRSGNVQPYLAAMILAALVLSESKPAAAGCLMALAITFKIWPVFFLPWFLRRDRRAALLWLVPAILALWLVPLTIWNPDRYLDLIVQWYTSESRSAESNSEIWYFPGQSLRGVMLRYFTASDPWIRDFPSIHLIAFAPDRVVSTWKAIALLTYIAACIAMLRSHPQTRWTWDGLSFALCTLLQPFCLKSSMILLGPAILMAASLYSGPCRSPAARRCFAAGATLAFMAAVGQYRPFLRLMLALGVDFYAAVLLLAALLLWTAGGPRQAIIT